MSIDNIVIPGGILAAWDGPIAEEDGDRSDRREAFDVTQVARQRARTLSVSFPRPAQSREDGSVHLESIVVTNGIDQRPLQRHPTDTDVQGTQTQRTQRPHTINLGNFGRSRMTDIPELENTYVFESLGNTQPSDGNTSTPTLENPIFLGRQDSHTADITRKYSVPKRHQRNQSYASQFSTIGVVRRASVIVENTVGKVKETVSSALRRSSVEDLYEKAKIRKLQLKRSTAAQVVFEYAFYLFLLACVYFVFVGVPLWNGLVLTIYYIFDMKLLLTGGFVIFLGIGFLYAYLPLLILFEKEPPENPPPSSPGRSENGQADDTALLIPCYKSESLIAATLEAALKVFPPQNIFVVANGNSPTPLDNTAAVCEKYNVSHTWSPVGSKIVAQYVGCYVAKSFPYVLLIDDDCLLPPNFPIVTERFTPGVQCIGYTIKSVGPDSSKGTLCQQAQDMEYKISGIQRAFAGKIGSATFPHGAISIWGREILIKTFQAHPGFSVSEDWFFGHVARQLGCRIQMCTAVFVETETPNSIFFSGGGARGGFGEMTIWKQRFFRWNFFFVSGIYYDMLYILCDWKLGWWELGAKIFVFQEVYETLLYLLAPFVLPISFYVRPSFAGYLFLGTILLYMVNVVIFNYVHLRLRRESVSVLCLMYYLPYKMILTFVNIASCYYSIYKYAKYFAKRHPKVIEDEEAVAVVLRLEEQAFSATEKATEGASGLGRRFTVTAVGTNLSSVTQQAHQQGSSEEDIEVVDFANQATTHLDSVPEGQTSNTPWQPSSMFGQMPPHNTPSFRPFSWGQSTLNNSSGSNRQSLVSPLDPRMSMKLQFPMPSPEATIPEEPWAEDPPTATTRPSPALFRRSLPANFIKRSSSGQRPEVRQPTGAPAPNPHRHRYAHSNPRNVLHSNRNSSYTTSNRDSTHTFNFPTPGVEPPPAAALPERPRSFVVVGSARGGGVGWPLPENTSRYISALADNGNPGPPGRSLERLFIAEEDVDGEGVEGNVEGNIEEGPDEEFTVQDTLDGREERRGSTE